MKFRSFLRRYLLKEEAPHAILAPLPQPANPGEPGEARREASAGPRLPFLSGVEGIDRQHMDLLLTIQDLGRAIREHHGASVVATTMGSLVTYTEDHFAYEEGYMRHIGFPGLEPHREAHTYFRHQIEQFQTRVTAGDPAVVLELSSLLYQWLQDHISQDDAAYVEYARSKRTPPL